MCHPMQHSLEKGNTLRLGLCKNETTTDSGILETIHTIVDLYRQSPKFVANGITNNINHRLYANLSE